MNVDTPYAFCQQFYNKLNFEIDNAVLQPGQKVRTDRIDKVVEDILNDGSINLNPLIRKMLSSGTPIDRTRAVAMLFSKACVGNVGDKYLKFIGEKLEAMNEFAFLDGTTRMAVFEGRIRLDPPKGVLSGLRTFARIGLSDFSECCKAFYMKFFRFAGYEKRKKVLDSVNEIRTLYKKKINTAQLCPEALGEFEEITNELEQLKSKSSLMKQCVDSCLSEVKYFELAAKKVKGSQGLLNLLGTSLETLRQMEYGDKENQPIIPEIRAFKTSSSPDMDKLRNLYMFFAQAATSCDKKEFEKKEKKLTKTLIDFQRKISRQKGELNAQETEAIKRFDELKKKVPELVAECKKINTDLKKQKL